MKTHSKATAVITPGISKGKSGNEANVVSLFSGGGGLDLGLEAAGFRSRYVCDIDPFSCRTLEAGFIESGIRNGHKSQSVRVVCGNVAELTGSAVLESSGLKRGTVDLLAGGPPCQAFSVFGRRQGVADPRGLLAFEYLRLVAELRPRAFLFENVFGLLTIEKGAVFERLCEQLSKPTRGLRYKLSIFRLDAADFGIPQFRDRVFIIGSLDGVSVSPPRRICAPESSADGALFTHPIRFRTVADAFRGLPPIGRIPNHTGRDHSQRIVERYEALRPGERDSKTRINRLDLRRPSFTIIVGSDKGGGKGHVHPIEPREVTPRESARLQTFPDWWGFSGSCRHPIRQVGNAVPPLLAAQIGREVAVSLFGLRRVKFSGILKHLSQEHLFQGDSSGIRALDAD